MVGFLKEVLAAAATVLLAAVAVLLAAVLLAAVALLLLLLLLLLGSLALATTLAGLCLLSATTHLLHLLPSIS